MNQFIMSVDLGRNNDWTAITIIKEGLHEVKRPKFDELDIKFEGESITSRVWQIVHMDRVELGTDYVEVVRIVKELLETPELEGNCDLVIDATGVGTPVCDFMRNESLNPIPLVYTSGTNITQTEDGFLRVPKSDLVHSLQFYWNSGRLKYPRKLAVIDAFLAEMESFVMKMGKSASVSYEAMQEQDHDDLVMSCAMAVWWGSYSRPWAHRRSLLDKPEPPYDPRSYLLTDDHQ
jgi:hypothetical protein